MMKENAPYAKYKQNRHRQSAGFTMAELLVVVAIIGILAGVSFVAVQQHEKTVTQLQYDTIAKEIFVAAQNHLTLAKSENYQDTDALVHSKGTQGKAVADQNPSEGEGGSVTYNNDIYYFYSGDTRANSILDQMLPFGSVELVTGGSYIIRYQHKAAKVLDVFYWTDGSERYDANLGKDDYVTLVDSYREDAHKNHPDGLLGWCGGEGVVDSGDYLEAPVINVINDALLLVEVTDTNKSNTELSPQLKLIVTGEKSGAKVAIPLSATGLTSRVKYDGVKGQFIVVLDDITSSGMHFAEINGDVNYVFLKNGSDDIAFIPGENISIQAVAYSNTVLTSVAYSGEWTTNSLFGEVPVNKETKAIGGTTSTVVTVKDNVYISNIRHLENLNEGLSGVVYSDSFFGDDGNGNSISAVQTVDLNWNSFITKVNTLQPPISPSPNGEAVINIYDKNGLKTKNNSFLPVSSEYTLTYDGQFEVVLSETTGTPPNVVTTTKNIKENHIITGIVVDNTDATEPKNVFINISTAGVFGSLSGATIKNLALIDTNVNLTTSGDAGTLAGTLIGSTVKNVVAYNTATYETTLKTKDATLTTVKTAAGNAGGLIGSINARTEVSKCAAAVIVNATGGNAGGLIGSVSSTAENKCTVTGSYAGGHTIDSTLTGSDAIIYDSSAFNVTAAEKESVGGVAGGLIGTAQATEISHCYSTCSATGTTVGGLIGTGNGAITHSYCTGLVKSTIKKTENTSPIEGAFAGTYTGTASGCMYFEIVNEREETYTNDSNVEVPTGGYTYLSPVSGSDTVTGVSAFDETAATFNAFSFDTGVQGYSWQNAMPYNEKLKAYYGENTTVGSDTVRIAKYILKTVAQLGQTDVTVGSEKTEGTTTTIIPDDFVATHYGDWPAPEIFVPNTAG